jgi:S1-C subfamily serine protease
MSSRDRPAPWSSSPARRAALHPNLLDLVLLVAIALYALGGYRKGAVVGVCSFAGFFGGAALGAQWARPVADSVGGSAQVPVAVVFVLGLAMIGQFLGVLLAGRIRAQVRSGPIRTLDNVAGAALADVALLLVAWMVAVPLASAPYPSLAGQVRRSEVIRAVDNVVPDQVRTLYSSLQQFIDRSGFPQVLGDLQPTTITDVAPADPALLGSPVVARVRSSVLKVEATSTSCSRGSEGSSFVYAPQHVLTNAHVVAGSNQVIVQTSAQGNLRARVVLYDPKRDVAVLYVPGLQARPLALAAKPAVTGQDAIVLGYPKDGPFDVRAARIRSRTELTGRDIYGDSVIRRDIYTIRSTVRPGNSGGPLMDTSGTVLGIVFASALDSSDTGFVLSAEEVSGDAAAGEAATATVPTGKCD